MTKGVNVVILHHLACTLHLIAELEMFSGFSKTVHCSQSKDSKSM